MPKFLWHLLDRPSAFLKALHLAQKTLQNDNNIITRRKMLTFFCYISKLGWTNDTSLCKLWKNFHRPPRGTFVLELDFFFGRGLRHCLCLCLYLYLWLAFFFWHDLRYYHHLYVNTTLKKSCFVFYENLKVDYLMFVY